MRDCSIQELRDEEIGGMNRRNSFSSNSSSSPAEIFSPQLMSVSEFSQSPTSQSIIQITKIEPSLDGCEHWKEVFPAAPKELPKNVCPEFCDVCGDVSTGYHYEVPSCNGCKTFFRRAVLGQKIFECKKNGECKNSMNKEIRVKCRACRFERCVEAGMNPLAIISETSPQQNKVVRDILSKRRLIPEDQVDQPSTSHDSPKLFIHPQIVENTIDRMIDELLHLEVAFDRFRKSNFNTTKHDRMSLTVDDCLKGHSKLGFDYGIASFEEAWTPPPHFQFIPIEKRIRDRIPFQKPPRNHHCKNHHEHGHRKMWHIMDLVHSVEYLKTFDFFHKLTEKDKRTLARHMALITAIITNSFFSVEQGSEFTVHPDGISLGWKIPLNETGEDFKHDRMYHFETVQRVKALKLDRKEYVILKALIACNPAIEDLSTFSREIMQEQREKYAKSLMSYMMARRGFREAPSAYAEIMSHIDWLTRLVKQNKDLHLLISALGLVKHGASPILEEIFTA